MFSENFVVIHETEPVFTINNPIYVRFSILDLRKLLIHEFYYNHIKRKCNANLLFTDTDSWLYEIKTYGVYKYFCRDKNLLDFSNFPKYSKILDLSKKSC